jgi:hypothetical protein
MNKVHTAFASEPALPLSLEGLFEVLDGIEPQERYEYLAPVIQDVLMALQFQSRAGSYDAAYQEVYDAFKAKCLGGLSSTLASQFLAYSIVARSLAWLCICSDERHIQNAVENQRKEIRKTEAKFAARQISRDERDRTVRDCEERLNNLPSDRLISQERYDSFCVKVVRQFLFYPVED